MKTIGIIVSPYKLGGGVYQYSQSLIQALQEDKTRRYVLLGVQNSGHNIKSELEIRWIRKDGTSNWFIKIIRFVQTLFFIRCPFSIPKQEMPLYADIDFIISPMITLYPHFYINKPYIFTLHDMQERHFPAYFTLKERFIRWITNRAATRYAAGIICESEFVKNDIMQYTKTKSEKIKVIQSPPHIDFIDFVFIQDKARSVREKYKLPNKYIFYPAQYWYHKNHLRLLEAFKLVTQKYNDVFLVLSGSKQNNYQQIQNKIIETNLQNKVVQLGYIDWEDMPYIYKESVMLVMPSLHESVSIPIYEAFALAVPVCCSNVVALPEQVGNAGFLFDPYNINDMVEKIESYLSNDKLRIEKAKLGYDRIRNFNHVNYKEKLNDLLQEAGF